MSAEEERIPADEFARRYGWRTSAVIHRIRAGIYDGVKDGNTWYVVKNSTPESRYRQRILSDRRRQELRDEPRELPWDLVQYPLRWVSWVSGVISAIFLVILYVTDTDHELILPLVGLGLLILMAALLVEAFRTGAIRNKGYTIVYSDHPFQFWFLVVTYAMLLLTAVAMLIMGIVDWFGAV